MKEIFQPHLHLHREPDGEYTLHAITLTPNSRYAAGRVHPGIPPEVRLTAETFSVILELRVRRGRALHIPTPVRHHLRHLRLGAAHGKTQLTAFAMLHGHVVGTASVPIHSSHEQPQKAPTTVDSTDWYAWRNRMPGGPASFHITGVVYLPSPGYQARLVRAAPQGINPKELILDLEVTPLAGFWPQVLTPASVRFDDDAAGLDYTGVLVRDPDGDAVHLEVDEVR